MSRFPHAPYWLVLLLSPAGLAAASGTASTTPPAPPVTAGTPATTAVETPAATAAGMPADDDAPHYGWVTREQLKGVPAAQRPKIDPTCPGVWVTPIPAGTKVGSPTLSNIEIQADDVHYDSASTSTLKGRVSIRQPGRRIDADEADLTQANDEGHFRGNILIAEPGLLLTGDQADFDFDTERATIRRTEFVSSVMHAHGRADQIERRPDGRLKIAHGVYSTCPPNDRTWAFEARNIRLNPETGRGEVSHAILQIKDVPVFYVPYFNFPIDERRQSGILVPRFGNTNDGGFDFALPVYLNLAPNYDATITPRLMSRRGTMVEGEFRYLLPIGSGQVQAGYLPSDSLYQNRDRKSLAWKQNGNITPDLQLNTDVNYVSDNAYFIDLGTDLSIVNTAFQDRKGELIYTPGDYWSLTTTVQTFQTIDPSLTDAEKPYSRLPQLLFTAGRPVAEGFAPALRSELVYFDRQVNDGSGPEINGARFAFDPSMSYVMEAPAGRLVPRLRLRTLQYELTGNGVPGGLDHESIAVPDASVDGTLVFERNQDAYTQTLEPRLFYLYSPYHDQSELPNFDTAVNTFTYQQLFRDSRFAGGDRLDDANQLSMGLTSRIIAPDSGEEIIRASVGQIHYFRDRKVRLTPTAPIGTGDSSGLAAQVAAPIGRGWSSTADALWTADLQHATQFGVNFNYLPETRDRLANIGYTYRRDDPTIGQQAMRQANLSFVQPFAPSWQLIGLWQYDIRTKQVQEQVAGLQYEACCWKIRLFDRRFLADPDNVSPGARRERSAFFVEIQLKGLAGLSSGVKSLLNNNMFGYNQLVEQNSSRPEFH
ncbi:MAG TPA: LPS assembly protein LptD [Moraxellaceae bacterium]|nr:LPS assembly protein LptD [Moraxellaceae bacterium]